jgi:hypothetical protein
MCHNFQYFHAGLGTGGNNMFAMRDDGLVPSEYAGWILLVWAINMSQIEITCRYTLHWLIMAKPFLLNTELAMDINAVSCCA